MKFILAKKQHMTQYFAEDGKVFPATVVSTSPLTVTQIKTKESDGYDAVQVGMGDQKTSRVSKSTLGHTKGVAFKVLKEFRDTEQALSVGDIINAEVFEKGDKITVSGISKGKGFQGVVKRHGFAGDKRTHGRKHSERKPGSIGGGLRARVPKGMRMAGRMGSDRVSVKNLEVLYVNPLENVLYVKGAIPGRRGTLIEIVGQEK